MDYYELTMAQGYFLRGLHRRTAVFDYFFRRNPFNGGYTVFAGLEQAMDAVLQMRFSAGDLRFLKQQGFRPGFLEYLRTFRFRGTVRACREGEVVFPGEPVLVVEAGVLEAQLIETVLLNRLNFQSLIATKAARIVQAADGRPVADFGLRRAQGMSGVEASRAAFIGGVVSTSNVLAGRLYGIPLSGTMGHSWVQLFDDELTAFRTYADLYPDQTVLLIDTFDTLRTGLPNAVRTARAMAARGHALSGVRLDSGDLAYLSRQVRLRLDEAGLPAVRIVASGNLDEYLIESMIDQDSRIDAFGVGTRMVTGYDQPALDGVYKLSAFQGTPKLKLSENIEKINNPGCKRLRRYLAPGGAFLLDGVVLAGEGRVDKFFHPDLDFKNTAVHGLDFEDLLVPVVRDGKPVGKRPALGQIREYSLLRRNSLPTEHRRFANPHIYRVGLSRRLFQLKRRLIKEHSEP